MQSLGAMLDRSGWINEVDDEQGRHVLVVASGDVAIGAYAA